MGFISFKLQKKHNIQCCFKKEKKKHVPKHQITKTEQYVAAATRVKNLPRTGSNTRLGVSLFSLVKQEGSATSEELGLAELSATDAPEPGIAALVC